MEGVIYSATNIINGKMYVGQTIDFEKRKKSHKYDAEKCKRNVHFHLAINKYGWDNFEWDILVKYELDSREKLKNALNKAEQYYIKVLDTYRNGYNSTTGGNANKELHPDSIEKMRQKLLGRENPNKWKSVICIETGQIFKKLTDAVEFIGDNHIHDACRKGIFCGGYQWRYLEDYEAMYPEELEELLGNRKKRTPKSIIICLDTMESNSVEYFADKYDIPIKNIQRVSSGSRKSAKGHRFYDKEKWDNLSQEERNKLLKYRPSIRRSDKVICIEKDVVYNSPENAGTLLGIDGRGIRRACRRSNNKYKGYHWKFLKDFQEIKGEYS